MLELTIGGQVYSFRFGMGFLKEINGRISVQVEDMNGAKRNVGLRWAIAQIMDGDVETLVDVLDVANKGESPRLTRKALESYVEDDSTDIDELFSTVLNFFKCANCTRKTMEEVVKAVEEQKAKEQQGKR